MNKNMCLVTAMALTAMLLTGFNASAASCKVQGCPRYPNSNGYCSTHSDMAKERAVSRNTQRATSNGAAFHPVTKPDPPSLPDVLMPLTEFSLSNVVSDAERTWTDRKERKMLAKLTHVSEDGEKVFLTFSKSKKYSAVAVNNLSQGDQKYVRSAIAEFKKKGKVWVNGAYLDKDEAEEFAKREQAKALIASREDVANRIKALKVFQVMGNRALCYPCIVTAGGVCTQNYKPVMYVSKNTLFLADGDVLDRRFFWCGTWHYETRGNGDKTINVVSDDPAYCIERVMNGAVQDATRPSAPPAPKEKTAEPSLYCTGSGFFITRDGYLVTNHHVIEGGSKFCVLADTGRQTATLVISDPETDLALLKVSDVNAVPMVFSHKRTEGLGAPVMTMGFPQPGLQGFDPKVTKGVISGINGFMGDVRRYQIDASVQPGNSGGPLFDDHGCLVGVVVSSLTKGQVVNYAIKKSYLQAFLDNSPECSGGIRESDGNDPDKSAEAVVADVRKSCVFIETYK